MMKTVVKPDLKLKTSCINKSYTCLKVKEKICLIDFRFYQKIFIVLISMSTILIFSETPREFGKICESYNSRKICNVC